MLQDDSKVLLHKAQAGWAQVDRGEGKVYMVNFSRLASRLGTQLGGNLIYGKCSQTRETTKETDVIHGGQQKRHSQRTPNDPSAKGSLTKGLA